MGEKCYFPDHISTIHHHEPHGGNSVQFTDWHSILNNEGLIENQILVLCQSVNWHKLKDIYQFLDANMHILITLKI